MEDDDLRPEYDVDYSKARPNGFAQKGSRMVVLDPDVAQVFDSSEAVNKALRAFIEAMPKKAS